MMEEIDRTGRLEDNLKDRILKAADEYAELSKKTSGDRKENVGGSL